MTTIRTRTKNGFEYSSMQLGYGWLWWYRPIGAAIEADGPQNKKQMLALLDDPEKALAAYYAWLKRATDVAAKERDVRDAQAFYDDVRSPGWDPGNRRNNPGAVARDQRRASASGEELERARNQLAYAISRRDQAAARPFDEPAWRAKYLPSK